MGGKKKPLMRNFHPEKSDCSTSFPHTLINSHPCLIRNTGLSFFSLFPASQGSQKELWKSFLCLSVSVPFCLDLETKGAEFSLGISKGCSGYRTAQARWSFLLLNPTPIFWDRVFLVPQVWIPARTPQNSGSSVTSGREETPSTQDLQSLSHSRTQRPCNFILNFNF